ncbi:hypothetical protein BU23DRAFT_573270 [Bimuria novae-zelandiae CBS 107.79]|uniref:Uncharacterized protein n=1 Tax=Bimuria novae-zelandiae CBS 107.79 TaxID=1447943 RepID=A0A6A5UQB4_9PLEO|nr:hypothetical protein BU23DRAFT_573270 [Bimuria novae-zelandiae CBS 107.79]
MRAEVYVKKYNDEFTRRHKESQKEPSTISGTTKASVEGLHEGVFKFLERKDTSVGSNELDTDEDTMKSELLENKWEENNRYMHTVPQRRKERSTAPSVPPEVREEFSNVIVFPPRAGWSELGHNQLSNHLSMSGFKPWFEEREPSAQDTSGPFERIGTGGNVLRGTLFWQPPASTAEADLYKSLLFGQTWFFGAQPVHAQFFSDMYKPQVSPYRISHVRPDTEKESLIISKDLVEIDELEFLGHIYKESDGRIFLDPTLTSVISYLNI